MSDAATHGAGEGEDPVGALAAAAEDLEAVTEEIAARGEDTVERAADVYEDVVDLLDRYEERATDWDDLEGYAELRANMSARVENLPEDVPDEVRDAVEAADETLVTGGIAETLSPEDFERARAELAPAREYADLRERKTEARQRYRRARRRLLERRDALRERVADLEDVAAFEDAALEADRGPVRDPVEAYDDAVAADFDVLVGDWAARAALEALAAAARRPLLGVERPPADLVDYLRDYPAGEQSLRTLREWTEYSASKLDHYVEDRAAFRRAVATNGGYLQGLGPEPFQVGWPPPPADQLRWWCGECEPAVRRFADERTVAALRRVRALPAETDYRRLRRGVVARTELDERARRLLREGRLEAEREAVREDLARVDEALGEYPPADQF